MAKFILHEDPVSMNCYKVRLTAALMGQEVERRFYDVLKGETRTPEFLANISSWGRLPVLQIDEKTLVPESDAACWYIADVPESKLIPTDRLQRTQMMRWMFFEQNEHETSIAAMRFWKRSIGFDNLDAAKLAQIPERRSTGERVLQSMDKHLENSKSGWFVGDSITLADVVLYPYTHVAADGGFNMDNFPNLQKWFKRIESLDRYIPA